MDFDFKAAEHGHRFKQSKGSLHNKETGMLDFTVSCLCGWTFENSFTQGYPPDSPYGKHEWEWHVLDAIAEQALWDRGLSRDRGLGGW